MTLPEMKSKVMEEAQVRTQKRLAEGVYRLELSAPEHARHALPGQFVQVQVKSPSVFLRRPLGLAEADTESGSVALIYREVGKGTAALAALRPGEQVNLLGPLGQGFCMDVQHPLLVGGGMGLSPLLCYARHLRRHGAQPEVLMGGRSAAELFWQDLFAPYAAAIHLTTDDGSLGRQGFVTALLPELLARGGYDSVAACGPEIMMRGVAAIAREQGLPCEVSLERRMGCGLGACLSCAIDTASGRRKVCKDGPVFPAEEVFY